jgi:hypothetical protein
MFPKEDTAMARQPLRHPFAAALIMMVLAWTAPALAVPSVITDFGAGVADIQDGVDNFRAVLGNPNNGNGGSTIGGRREINWDGGSTAIVTNAPGGTPFNVFLNNRGAQFTTTGTGFVQAPKSGVAPDGLTNFFSNATYGTTFAPFSLQRLFVPVGSNAFDALFFVPGTNGATRAIVSGFGAVFSDVDVASLTHMDFFDIQEHFLGSFAVPVGGTADASLSFLGVTFSTEQIGRVHIVLGNAALATGVNDNPAAGVELVALDDVLFAEPRGVPAPAGLTLLGLGLAGLLGRSWLKKRGA